MSLYSVEFDSRALNEAVKLPLFLRRQLREDLEFLRAAPYRSHPGVSVKELRGLRGVWRFHLGRTHRVFYTTIGGRLIVILIDRNPGVTSRTLSEVVRRLR